MAMQKLFRFVLTKNSYATLDAFECINGIIGREAGDDETLVIAAILTMVRKLDQSK